MSRIYRRAVAAVGTLAVSAALAYGCRGENKQIQYSSPAPLDTLCTTTDGPYTSKTLRWVNVHGDSALDAVFRVEGQKQENGKTVSCTMYEVFIKRGNEFPNAPKYAAMVRDSARKRVTELQDSARIATDRKILELQIGKAAYDTMLQNDLKRFDRLEEEIDQKALGLYDLADKIQKQAIKRDETNKPPKKRKRR